MMTIKNNGKRPGQYLYCPKEFIKAVDRNRALDASLSGDLKDRQAYLRELASKILQRDEEVKRKLEAQKKDFLQFPW